MTKRKKKDEGTPKVPSPLREEGMEINGQSVKAGDPVKVLNPAGNYLRGKYEFRALVLSDKGSWIDVYGGTSGREMPRAFPLDRIEVVPERRRKKPTTT